MAKVNRLYFIEESVFNTEKFYLLLESLLDDPKAEPYFAVDANIQETITKYFSMGLLEEAYNIQTYLYFFANRKKLEYINTSGFLDLEDFMSKSAKYDEVYVLTQQDKIFDVFKGLEAKMPTLRIYCVKHQNIVEWKEIEKTIYKAFYLKKDKYVNPIDIEKIDYVYSPKYGYLKLDKEKGISGGEGICYATYNNFYVKLYNEKHLSYINMKRRRNIKAIITTR